MKFDGSTRAYIAGCGGMLGDALYRQVQATGATVKATDIVATEPWITFADIRDPAAILKDIETFRPTLILNLAALTDLEQCEREPDNAWQTNAYAAEHLAKLALSLGIPHVFISTAGIFDGKKDVYTDEDVPNPLSVYGKTKHYGENAVLDIGGDCLVLRAGWMMGGGPSKDKKFVNKLYQQICAGKTTIEVVTDKHGTPTYTDDFARGILALLTQNTFGRFNMVGEGRANRFDVACEFVKLLGRTHEIEVRPVTSEHFLDTYFAPRPLSEQLENTRLESLGLYKMPHWRSALRRYVTQEFHNEQI